jgi:hypothetical protein
VAQMRVPSGAGAADVVAAEAIPAMPAIGEGERAGESGLDGVHVFLLKRSRNKKFGHSWFSGFFTRPGRLLSPPVRGRAGCRFPGHAEADAQPPEVVAGFDEVVAGQAVEGKNLVGGTAVAGPRSGRAVR